MKAIKAKVTGGIYSGTTVVAADNSGARLLKVISVIKKKTVKNRYPIAGVGDIVSASVIKGTSEMRGTVVRCIVVRQRKPYKRYNGQRVCYEDNAVVVLKDEKGLLKGTTIKGCVSKEAAERWSDVAKLSSIIL